MSYNTTVTDRVPFRIGTGNRGLTYYCQPRALENSGLYAFMRKRDRE